MMGNGRTDARFARSANLMCELFKGRGSFALRILLVHPVEHRQIDRLGVDQFDIVAPELQPLDYEFGEPNARSVGTIGAVENKNPIAHHIHSAAEMSRQRAVRRPLANRSRWWRR